MMFVSPDNDDNNNQRLNDSADDEDYDPMPVTNPLPKSRPKKVARNKKSEPKLILDRNFMCFLRHHTFDHEPFRRGKKDVYSIAEMEQFDADFHMQLHFNFLATQTTQKQKQVIDATRASRLRDVDLDALPEITANLSVISSKRQELSRYVLEDILDCPVGSRFIVCIAAEDNDDNWCRYYMDTAKMIEVDLRRVGLPLETWRMSSKRYLVIQGRIDRSLHYNDIKMKHLTQRQFCDAFSNKGGDVAIRFDGISTRLTIPWRDFIYASRCIMLFGFPFAQGRLFAKLFRKMKPQHAHHIFCQFASEYYGDSRASSMLYIEYQQARLNAAVNEVITYQGITPSASNLFQESLFLTKRAKQFQRVQ